MYTTTIKEFIMNGWAIGSLLCLLYTVTVIILAGKKSPGLIKMVKMKLGKNTTDRAALTASYVMSGIFGAAGIVMLVLAVTAG